MYEDEEFLDESFDFTQDEKKCGSDVNNNAVGSSCNAAWTKHGILALLSIYEANSHVVENPRKKTKIRAIISQDLHHFGIETPDQIRWKMNALQKKYKECIDNNKKSGRGHMTFEFYDKLEKIFHTGKNAAATYTLTSNVGRKEAENSIEPKKNNDENDPGNAIELQSHRAGKSGLQQPKKNLTSGKRTHELEDQWLCHFKKFGERQELADEKYAETNKMRMESFNIKKHQLVVRERQIDVAEKITTKKLKSKEKRHDELLEIEQQKCQLLQRLLDKP